jgi:hypothetical protein
MSASLPARPRRCCRCSPPSRFVVKLQADDSFGRASVDDEMGFLADAYLTSAFVAANNALQYSLQGSRARA